jgi:hypothetical protein
MNYSANVTVIYNTNSMGKYIELKQTVYMEL